MGQVQAGLLAALDHRDAPFEQVVEACAPPRDPAATPLFQIKFQLEPALDDLEAAALADERVAALVDGKNVVKVIAIPGRMVNLVVK